MARNTVWNLLGWGSLTVLSFISAPLFLHELGSVHYGLLALLTTLVTPFGLLEFGTGEATIKYVSESLGRRDYPQAERYVNTTLSINAIVGAVGGAAMLLAAAPLITHFFKVEPVDRELALTCLVAVAVNWAFTRVRLTFVGVASALRNYKVITVGSFGYQFIYVIGGLTVLATGGGLATLVKAQAAVSVLGAIVWYFVIRSLLPEIQIRPVIHPESLGRTLKFGAWQFGNYVGDIFIQQGLRWQLGAWVSVSAVGYYNICYQMACIIYTVATRAGQVLFPEISSLQGQGKTEEGDRLLALSNWAISCIVIPGYAALYVVAPDILRAWAGAEAAQEGGGALRILCLGLAVASVFAAPSFYLLGTGRPKWLTLLSAGQAILTTGVAYALVHTQGIRGAAWALTSSTMADIVIMLLMWKLIFRGRCSLADYLAANFGSFVIGLCCALGFAQLFEMFELGHGWLPTLAVATLVGLVTLAACLGIGGLLPGGGARLAWALGGFDRLWRQGVASLLGRPVPLHPVQKLLVPAVAPLPAGQSRLGAGIDKVGQVIAQDRQIFREITPDYQDFYRGILEQKELMDELFACGLVRTTIAQPGPGRLRLQHEFIERHTYWHEWSFDMLKDAALLTVRLTKRLLRDGLCLKDAHPYNIMFKGAEPVFVDFGSIVPATPAMQKSWERSFYCEFLLPLNCLKNGRLSLAYLVHYLENTPTLKEWIGLIGVRMPPWPGICPMQDGFTPALDSLEKWLMGLRMNVYGTVWEDYYSRGQTPVVGQVATYTNKERAAARFMERARTAGARTLLDVASNEGWFARLAAGQGFEVVAFDYDERAINNFYGKLEGGAAILPVVMNFRLPSKAHGPGNIWPAAADRLASDVTLAMAVVHHLALGQGMSLEDFARQLSCFARRFCIVEFITPADVHIRKRARRRPWYTQAAFERAMGVYFRQLDCAVSEPDTRLVYYYERLPA